MAPNVISKQHPSVLQQKTTSLDSVSDYIVVQVGKTVVTQSSKVRWDVVGWDGVGLVGSSH